MLENILTDSLSKAINMLNFQDLTEIRIRLSRPVMVGYKNSQYFLGHSGLCRENDAIVATKDMINEIVSKASNHSVYAVNEKIKEGFLSTANGVRIGITGTVVLQNNDILTVKDISSLNIRIPHQIIGASYKLLKYLIDDSGNIQNTLIIGAPGVGKTTILRDLCFQFNKLDKSKNILLLDERFEIAGTSFGEPQMNVGISTDVVSGGKKMQNITNGIRSMSPDVVFVDEIGTTDDIFAVEYTANCGVNVVATVHSKDIFEIQKKQQFENILKAKVFKRFVVISSKEGKGTIENIYDEFLRPILRFIW